MPRWLWLVSVGATDVQFPAWRQDDAGVWTQLHRVEVSRHDNMRGLHEALIWLDSTGGLTLCPEVPEVVKTRAPASVKIDKVEVDGEAVYSVALQMPAGDAAGVWRISPTGDELPNVHDQHLSVFFPKVSRLLQAIQTARGEDSIAVVVLNTRRTQGSMAAKEPVAAGRLVSRFIAQELRLQWLEGGQALPGTPIANTCTWLDILQGNETLEDPSIETALPSRLNAVFGAWGNDAEDRVVISTAGGLPGLKPIIERIPAINAGSAAVATLDNPENAGTRPLELRPLAEKWVDRETLRFHCAQALREGEYVSAYGVARRRLPARWASAVVQSIGPLVELPATGAQVPPFGNFRAFELRAARIEAALVMGNVLQAIRQLHTFIESVTWTILRRSRTLRSMGLTVSPNEEAISLLEGRRLPAGLGRLIDQFRPLNYAPSGRSIFSGDLASWLLTREQDARLGSSLSALTKVARKYRARSHRHIKDGLNDLRNALSHGAGGAVDPTRALNRFTSSGLAKSVGKAYGSNFLAVPDVHDVISGLRAAGAPSLADEVNNKALRTALEAVVRGDV